MGAKQYIVAYIPLQPCDTCTDLCSYSRCMLVMLCSDRCCTQIWKVSPNKSPTAFRQMGSEQCTEMVVSTHSNNVTFNNSPHRAWSNSLHLCVQRSASHLSRTRLRRSSAGKGRGRNQSCQCRCLHFHMARTGSRRRLRGRKIKQRGQTDRPQISLGFKLKAR